jgi:hypothetical protein
MRGNNKWRHLPKRPAGLYAAYLSELIERNRAKRETQAEIEAEEKYWRDRERHHAEQQEFKKAA